MTTIDHFSEKYCHFVNLVRFDSSYFLLCLLLSRPRNFAKSGYFYCRNIVRIDIYVVKIDVKDWPDNVHGGERVIPSRCCCSESSDTKARTKVQLHECFEPIVNFGEIVVHSSRLY